MEKTWIRFLLPDDEYKRRTMLVYFAEAAILQLIAVIALIIISRFELFPLEGVIVLIGMMFGTIAYIWIRYILSGMEFTEIMTEKAYRRERNVIVFKSATFFLLFSGTVFILHFLGVMSDGIIDSLIASFIGAVLLFLTNYVSLRKSYRKNRELID